MCIIIIGGKSKHYMDNFHVRLDGETALYLDMMVLAFQFFWRHALMCFGGLTEQRSPLAVATPCL